MKNIKYLLLLATIVTVFFACESDEQAEVLEGLETAGLIIDASATSSSSILGNPDGSVALEDATVDIVSVYFDMTIELKSGNLDDIEKLEILRSFNGGEETVAATTETLSYNFVINDLESLLDGSGLVSDDLRIGDTFTFRTKITKTDGEVLYFSSSLGTVNLVVNCSSDLVGSYTVNYETPGVHVVTEVSPGLYAIDSMLGWPGDGFTVMFTDTCGQLALIDDWVYSNPISGEGYVDADGNLVWEKMTVDGVYTDTPYTMFKN
ncbi:hypothetical protein ACFFVB_15195 [Formosa undariae]|uniref:DUF4382 domain-containing protein n=1 Tax=Formosa undariae TaxID=1325436 RepID=A0ABV5F4S2_9FLAO